MTAFFDCARRFAPCSAQNDKSHIIAPVILSGAREASAVEGRTARGERRAANGERRTASSEGRTALERL